VTLEKKSTDTQELGALSDVILNATDPPSAKSCKSARRRDQLCGRRRWKSHRPAAREPDIVLSLAQYHSASQRGR